MKRDLIELRNLTITLARLADQIARDLVDAAAVGSTDLARTAVDPSRHNALRRAWRALDDEHERLASLVHSGADELDILRREHPTYPLEGHSSPLRDQLDRTSGQLAVARDDLRAINDRLGRLELRAEVDELAREARLAVESGAQLDYPIESSAPIPPVGDAPTPYGSGAAELAAGVAAGLEASRAIARDPQIDATEQLVRDYAADRGLDVAPAAALHSALVDAVIDTQTEPPAPARVAVEGARSLEELARANRCIGEGCTIQAQPGSLFCALHDAEQPF